MSVAFSPPLAFAKHQAGTRPRARRRLTGQIVNGLILPAIVAAAWEAGVRLGLIEARLMPPPSQIAHVFLALATSGELFRHVAATMARVGLGFACGAIAGTLLGAASGASSVVRKTFDPTVQALRAIPSIAWVPLFILWFGIFEASKVTLIALGVFFPVYLSVMAAIASVDRKLIEVGRIFRLSPLSLTRRVLLPAILPAWVVALRTGLGLGFMFVVAAEIMGASEGLGYLLVDGQQLGKPDEILVALITFAILGQACDTLVVMATRPLVGWQDTDRRPFLSTLSFDGVTKIYPDGTHALADVSLEVSAGEIVVLLGPSGCGKTSLLRIAAGLEEESQGAIRLDGKKIVGPHPAIGMVFQESRLMPWMTAAQNVAFGLSSDYVSAVEQILVRVGLAAQASKLPRDLSGGQQQRVALARALVTKPKVLLLDEPFSALDAMTREDLQDHLLDLWVIDRPTIVLVTHDIEEAAVLADRIAVLTPHPGRLKAVLTNKLPRPRQRDSEALFEIKQDLRALLQSKRALRQVKQGDIARGSIWSSFGAATQRRMLQTEEAQ